MASAPRSDLYVTAPAVARPSHSTAATQPISSGSFDVQNTVGGSPAPFENDSSDERFFGKSKTDESLRKLQASILGPQQLWDPSEEMSTTSGQSHVHTSGDAWLEQRGPFSPRPSLPLVFSTPVGPSVVDIQYPLIGDFFTRKEHKEEELKGLESKSQKAEDSSQPNSQETTTAESTEESASDEDESLKLTQKVQRKSSGPRYCPRDITKKLPSPKKSKKPTQALKRKRGQERFVCDFRGCKRDFARADGLKRHKAGHEQTAKYVCPYPKCEKGFSRFDNVYQHLNLVHHVGDCCPHCDQALSGPDMTRHLMDQSLSCHPSRGPLS